jgi:hypothetical protein
MKYLAIIFYVFLTTATFAQSNAKLKDKEVAKISYVVKGGWNLSNFLLIGGEDISRGDFKPKTGFHFGLTGEYPVSEKVAFETGILISSKGTKSSNTSTHNGVTYESNSTLNLLYLEIPLTAKTYFNVGQSKIFGALGPYIGLGIGGKYKGKVVHSGETNSYKRDIYWGSGTDAEFRRLDFGLTAAAGVEIRSIQIGLSYNLGLANISTFTDNGVKIKNRVLGLSVGYKFGIK